jgi:hypothetical protein
MDINKSRFLDLVKKTDTCWEWQGIKEDGYGIFSVDGKKVAAHRWAYEAFRKPIPEGKMICHRCDNPSCVRPKHLKIGTAQSNYNDAIRRNRTSRKLTAYEVKQIRELRKRGMTRKWITEKYGVSTDTIQDIEFARTWKWLK